MTLSFLEGEMEKHVYSKMEEMTFNEIVRSSRFTIGLKQLKAAEFSGINVNRLKNLETGYFREMPSKEEILAISFLYGIPAEMLNIKALEHVIRRQKIKKIDIIEEEESDDL